MKLLKALLIIAVLTAVFVLDDFTVVGQILDIVEYPVMAYVGYKTLK